jgi:hypothetical protein
MSINIVRLSTGEELIATVTETGAGLNLVDVAILIPTQANSLGLAPFMAYSDASKGFDIAWKDIMFVVKPVNQLESQYQDMFGKIIQPKQSIIT